jgi:hypothetical protein
VLKGACGICGCTDAERDEDCAQAGLTTAFGAVSKS